MSSQSLVIWRTNPWFRVLRYGFCPDEAAFERERNRVLRRAHIDLGDYPVSESTHGMTVCWRDPHGPHAMICLHASLDSEPIDLVSVIAHECVHVACAVIEAMSEKSPGEEFQAYLIGGLVADIFADYSKTRSPLAREQKAKSLLTGE